MKIIKCPKCGKSGTPYYNLRNEITGYDCVPCNVIDIEKIKPEQSCKDEISVNYQFHTPDLRIDRHISVSVNNGTNWNVGYITITDFQPKEVHVGSIMVNKYSDELSAQDQAYRDIYMCQNFSQNLPKFNDCQIINLTTTPMFYFYKYGNHLGLWLNTGLRGIKVIDL